MTGRACMGEVWLKSVKLFDKQVNAQREKTSGIYASSCKPTKKCAMKIKNDTCVTMLLMEGSTLYKAHTKN